MKFVIDSAAVERGYAVDKMVVHAEIAVEVQKNCSTAKDWGRLLVDQYACYSILSIAVAVEPALM